MPRNIVILSGMVDITIKEAVPQDRIILFNAIQELMDYAENTPIRAEIMYVTRDVLQPSVNTSLSMLMEILNNPFLVVDEILYITEKGSKELASISFMLEENKSLNWTNNIGSLTREYLVGLVAGTLRSEDYRPRRVNVFRQNKSEFLRNRLKNARLDEKYLSDEDSLADIPDEEVTPILSQDTKSLCEVLTISGIESKERTVFSILASQYLSYEGKTVIVERDYDYLTLTDMLARSELRYTTVNISDIYHDCEMSLRRIRNSEDKLILVTECNREYHDYGFVCNFIYNNLANHIKNIVVEKDLDELVPDSEATIVVPANLVDMLKTVEELPAVELRRLSFAILNMKNPEGYGISNTEQSKMILSDLMQEDVHDVHNINVKSLKLGGEAHDLRMLFKRK